MRSIGFVRDGFPPADSLMFTWASYTSTGAAAVLNDSENVASLTKNGAGDVSATFVGGYRDTGYAAMVGCPKLTSTFTAVVLATLTTTPFTPTAIRVLSLTAAGINTDTSQTTFMITGMP